MILEGSNDRIVVILRLFRGLVVKAAGRELLLFAEDFHLQPLEALMDFMVPLVVCHHCSTERRIDGHHFQDELSVLLVESTHIFDVVDEFFTHWILSPFWFNEFSFSFYFYFVIIHINKNDRCGSVILRRSLDLTRP